jgi:DedD protein
MRGVFDEEDLEPARARRDTELTLGSGTLLAIFFGLVLLCGLCFGLGYTMGHRNPQIAVTGSSGTDTPQTPTGGSLSKPSAAAQTPVAPLTVAGSAGDANQKSALPPGAVGESIPANQYTGQPTTQSAGNSTQAQVRPAMNPATAVAPPAQPNGTVRPALEPVGTFVVQIAAVSNQEDADVLSSALRKRGYAVNAKREPADNLIHVRIGPFVTAAEANNWKNRLLNDGYNAIVQQ